jgi:hypothetical protein
MTEKEALDILAQAINKAAGAFNQMELFAIQQAFLKLQEKISDEHTRKNQD